MKCTSASRSCLYHHLNIFIFFTSSSSSSWWHNSIIIFFSSFLFAGLSLYFNLPRHIFGQCQQILFPRYFTLNSILSIIALITFIKAHDRHHWILSSYVQVCALTLCAVIELTGKIYLSFCCVYLYFMAWLLMKCDSSTTIITNYGEMRTQMKGNSNFTVLL